MFCPNCGVPCDGTKPFCHNCGTALPQAQPTPEQSTQVVPEQTLTSTYKPFVSPVRGKLQELAKSPALLTALIAYVACAVLTVIQNIFSGTILYAIFGEISASLEMSELEETIPGFEQYLYSLTAPSVLSIFISMILTALVILGMWLTYSAAKNGKSSTAGLTIIKVFTIIDLVAISFLAALMLFLFVLALIVMAVSGAPVEVTIILSVVMVILLGACALLIVYYAKVLQTLYALRAAIANGVPSCKVSSFVIFFCWFDGIISSIIGGPAGIAFAVSAIAFALFLSKYKKEMRALAQQMPRE